MSSQTDLAEQIVQQLESQLCSGALETREEHWRSLLRSLRQSRHDAESASEAVTDFLISGAGASVGRGQPTPVLYQEYGSLSAVDKSKVDQQYRRCLEAAKAEIPHVFHVEVINAPAGVADLRFAARAGEPLPELNENQKSIADVFGIPREKYQREVQAKLYGEERYRLFAERFWGFVMEAGKSYSLGSVDVVYDVAAGKFYCELKSDGSIRRAAFAADVISVPIERGDKEGILRARDAVKVWLEEVLGSFVPTHT